MTHKKRLCTINDIEAREYSEVISNKQTFIILKNLMTEKGMVNDIDDIEKKIKEYSQQVDLWWEKITDKYEIPYFVDNSLGVDLNRNIVFITVDKE